MRGALFYSVSVSSLAFSMHVSSSGQVKNCPVENVTKYTGLAHHVRKILSNGSTSMTSADFLFSFDEKMVLSISFTLFIRYAHRWESPYDRSLTNAVQKRKAAPKRECQKNEWNPNTDYYPVHLDMSLIKDHSQSSI